MFSVLDVEKGMDYVSLWMERNKFIQFVSYLPFHFSLFEVILSVHELLKVSQDKHESHPRRRKTLEHKSRKYSYHKISHKLSP